MSPSFYEEMAKNMKFDEYSLKARIVPTFFSIIIPIIVFNHFYVSEEFSNLLGTYQVQS
jgi:hypothetical protein